MGKLGEWRITHQSPATTRNFVIVFFFVLHGLLSFWLLFTAAPNTKPTFIYEDNFMLNPFQDAFRTFATS